MSALTWTSVPALALLGLAAGETGGGETTPAAAPAPKVLQIKAREVWTGAGQKLENALIVIADGRIRSVGSAKDFDPRQPFIEHDGIVTAGMVACASQMSAGALQDDTRSVMPAARASLAFEPSSVHYEDVLAAGVTALVLTPGPDNLVGGLTCVVKTAGGRVLAPEATLALSLSADALGKSTVASGFFFGAAEEGAIQPDGQAESTGRTGRGTREPTSYSGAVTMLRELFARGQGAFGRAKKGELAVTIEAWDRHEVLRAAALAKELGLGGAIRGAPLAGDPNVIAALREAKLGVILGPYATDQTRASLESLMRLSAAQVPVGFAIDAPWRSGHDLRLTAARALAAGASRDAAWRALTSDAAKLAGVGEALGELAPGREADLVLWSGDPLDLSSHVEAVYVDGARAWPAAGKH
ncbi:MAG: amidohydrolase family protein [Planctomycetota bacterium]